MRSLVLASLATIVVVAFVMANSHHVAVSLVLGAPVKIRLIFLLASAFVMGMVVATFLRMLARAKAQRRARRMARAEPMPEASPEESA